MTNKCLWTSACHWTLRAPGQHVCFSCLSVWSRSFFIIFISLACTLRRVIRSVLLYHARITSATTNCACPWMSLCVCLRRSEDALSFSLHNCLTLVITAVKPCSPQHFVWTQSLVLPSGLRTRTHRSQRCVLKVHSRSGFQRRPELSGYCLLSHSN